MTPEQTLMRRLRLKIQAITLFLREGKVKEPAGEVEKIKNLLTGETKSPSAQV